MNTNGKHPKTNADGIRSMSDEDLADFLDRVDKCSCVACCGNLYWCRRNNSMEPICRNHYLDWLRQPAEKNGGEDL